MKNYVLIDEGQDFIPIQWLLARAVVPHNPDDLSIAKDSNQWIQGPVRELIAHM